MPKKYKPIVSYKLVFFLIPLLILLILGFGLIQVTDYVTVRGVIRPEIYRIIRSESSGFIKEVYVKDGKRVKKGDKLFKIKDKELSYKKERLSLGISLKYHYLQKLIKQKKNLSELLILLQAKSTLKMKENEALFKKKLLAKSKYLAQKISLKEAILNNQDKINTINYEIKSTTIKRQQDLLEYKIVNDKLQKTLVFASIDGIFIEKDNKQKINMPIDSNDELFFIYKESDLFVTVQIPENRIAKIKKNLAVQIFIDAFPHRKYKIFSGKLIKVSERPTKGFFMGTILLKSPNFKIKKGGFSKIQRILFGLSAEVKIKVGKKSLIVHLLGIDE